MPRFKQPSGWLRRGQVAVAAVKDPAARARTEWSCDRCDVRGVASYPVNAGVYKVVDLLRSEHAALSPSCDFDVAAVQVQVQAAAS